MLILPGHPIRTCEGLSRREWLRVGGLGALGLGMPELLAGRARAAHTARRPEGHGAGFGRARACIVLFMFGAPAHQDTWDLKPHGPADVRGEFDPIATSVPGVQISEHLPRLATMADRLALVRSLTHPDNTHTVAMHYMLSGARHRRPQTNPQNAPDDFPCYGAIVNYARKAGWRKAPDGTPPSRLPAAVSLNAPANQVSANNHIFPGFFAGLLGNAYDPLFVAQHASQPDFQPFPTAAGPARLLQRQRLLGLIDRQVRRLEGASGIRDFDAWQQQALDLLTSTAARRAFDLSQEPDGLREQYGRTPFGQGCLLARRLIEAGVTLVTVNWERDDAYWDTHQDNFARHREKLLPNLDRGFSALLDDLAERELLDETLIVCLGEFGRTPKINADAGRDHWAACHTAVLAGGGVPGGQIYGASDRQAAYPTRDPVPPEDLSATIYHLLGIAPQHTFPDPEGRPLPVSRGEPIWGALR